MVINGNDLFFRLFFNFNFKCFLLINLQTVHAIHLLFLFFSPIFFVIITEEENVARTFFLVSLESFLEQFCFSV